MNEDEKQEAQKQLEIVCKNAGGCLVIVGLIGAVIYVLLQFAF